MSRHHLRFTSLHTLLAAATLAAFVPTVASAADAPISVKLQNGATNSHTGTTYSGTSYETIISSTPNQNYGTTTSIQVGSVTGENRKTLLRFDLTDFQGMTVTSDATLTLYQRSPFGTGSFEIGVYQVTPANAGWIQGTGGGSMAPLGMASWNFKIKGESSNVLWAGSAGLGTAGVDYFEDPVATTNFTPSGNNGTPVTVTIAAEVLQGWIDAPETNAGLLLIADNLATGSYATFYHTSATQGVRPALQFSVVPSVVPEPSSVGALAAAAAFAFVGLRRKRA